MDINYIIDQDIVNLTDDSWSPEKDGYDNNHPIMHEKIIDSIKEIRDKRR